MSMNWEIDYYRGENAVLRHIVNGWSVSPIVKLRSGLPFTVTNGNVDANLDGNTNDRAELIGDPHIDDPTAAQWFNTAAFAQNRVVTGVATDGNSARNLLDGPGLRVVDLAISRDFQLPGDVRLTFRAEGTNVLQHRQPRAAGRRRAGGRDLHDLWRDPHRQCHAQDAVGLAPVLLNPRGSSAEHAIVAPHHNLRVATRGTSREINRRIALNLIRTNQPISRADLARLMGTRRGAVSLLVGELIQRRGGFRGRHRRGEARPQADVSLHRLAQAVRGRRRHPADAHLHDGDRPGRPPARQRDQLPDRARSEAVRRGSRQARQGRARRDKDLGRCQGVGVVVPGMVESGHRHGAAGAQPGLARSQPARPDREGPRPAGADRELRQGLCARAALGDAGAQAPSNFVYLIVSDGLGVGIVLGGEIVRGQHNIAGEFGHVPLNIDGPRCGCGASGCWEAYVSNLATLSRYFGRDVRDHPPSTDVAALTVDDLIARARGGDAQGAGRHPVDRPLSRPRSGLGRECHRSVARLHRRRNHRGLGSHRSHRARGARRAGADAVGRRHADRVVPPEQYPRLRGAAALVAAPSFAREVVA